MTDPTIKCPKKLIEVGLPLNKINIAAGREKNIRHGHPSTLHLWWARRPLAAARAIIFSQLVNDPSWKWELENPGDVPPAHLKASWAKSRKRLFAIIEELVEWENTNRSDVIERARTEIKKSWLETCEINGSHPNADILFRPDQPPAFHDPFAGGGALPLEAQRLGLRSFASDLNPVAVVINKSMLEIPSRFSGRPPINPEAKGEKSLAARQWRRAQGLAEDVRYYGKWLRDEAERRIGAHYPKVLVTAEMAEKQPSLKGLVGEELTVIAWLWARTVKSPNPAFRHVDVPLASSFVLSTKEGKEAYVEPIIKGDTYTFEARLGKATAQAKSGTKSADRGADFRCLVSDTPIDANYIRSEAKAGRMGARLMAMIAEGPRGRVYVSPRKSDEEAAACASPAWMPEVEFFQKALGFRVGNYGFTKWSDLFTRRQLTALSTLSELVDEVRQKVVDDFGNRANDETALAEGGSGPRAYSEAISVYLAFLVSQVANHSASVCGWNSTNTQMRSVFSRQALSMVWDYAESNPFSDSSGSYNNLYERQIKAFEALGEPLEGTVVQQDAQRQELSLNKVVSTDPPYYDNIGYADLSDFFYVWLRKNLRPVYPELFGGMTVPKAEELVATPHRHGGRRQAEAFFMDGMTAAMGRISSLAHPALPVSIYYAFKQSESDAEDGTTSTGWDTFLEAVIRAGFSINGTWPIRTEKEGRTRGNSSNALASSIVLVCRKRAEGAPSISRRAFLRELNAALPDALDGMTRGTGDEASPVAPVDLSQAIIGPGMAIFSKYASVLEADGAPMTVKTALSLINRFLAEDDFDPDTQFCLRWFEEYGWAEGAFGEANTLAMSKGTAVNGVQAAGIIEASAGRVRLLRWAEYPGGWSPKSDTRMPVWEVLHHLIRLFKERGEAGAGELIATVASKADAARQLAYRLYTLCERAGWADDARAYNEIITSWAAIEDGAARSAPLNQPRLFDA